MDKDKNRLKVRIASFIFFYMELLSGTILALKGIDITAYAILCGTLSTPVGALLVTDYITKPKN